MAREETTGIVVEDGALEWATFLGQQDSLRMTGSGMIDLSTEAVAGEDSSGEDEAGEPAVVSVADRIKKDLGRLKGSLTVGLASGNLIVRVVDLPEVEDDELQGIVELQIDKVSPFPLESMVVSCEILRKDEGSCRVLAVAVREEVVSSVGELVENAGLSPSRIDAAVLGWCRLLADAGEVDPEGRHAVIIMDRSAVEVIVFQDGVPAVFRSLPGADEVGDESFADETAREVGYTLMSLELEQGQAGGAPTVTLWKRGELSTRLAECLKEECSGRLTVRELDDLPSVCEGLVRRNFAAGGLDLTPQTWTANRLAVAFKHRMATVGVLLLVLWLALVGGVWGLLYYQQRVLESLMATSEAMKGPAMEVRDLRRRVFTIRSYMEQPGSALECLRGISEVQPIGIDLTDFRYRKGGSVKIAGEADDVDLVYNFKDKLDTSDLFLETSLTGPRGYKGKQVFDIVMKLPEGGAP